MMFTLLQKQHKAQLKSMVAANKQAIDMMFKCMNVLVASHGKAANKVTVPPANNNNVRASSSSKCNHVFQEPEDCYDFQINSSKHWPGWKLSKNASAPV
jgi:hypothetical protein